MHFRVGHTEAYEAGRQEEGEDDEDFSASLREAAEMEGKEAEEEPPVVEKRVRVSPRLSGGKSARRRIQVVEE